MSSPLGAFRISLSGAEALPIYTSLVQAGIAPAGLPQSVSVDSKDLPAPTDEGWLKQALDRTEVTLFARWTDWDFVSISVRSRLVKVGRKKLEHTPEQLADLLAEVPFELAAMPTLHPIWTAGAPHTRYNPPGFGDLHFQHGWAAALRGRGHDRLVSRRWLDYGPWRTLRAAHDTTLVQFHDLAASSADALLQAKPGHVLLGTASDKSGYIGPDYAFSPEASATYSPQDRALKLILAGREPTPRELRDAAASRYLQSLGPDSPVAEVRFVFVDEELARRSLPALWLYGHRCFLAGPHEERSLDADYTPPQPERPQWVTGLGRCDRVEG
jgi:hypothetical protein